MFSIRKLCWSCFCFLCILIIFSDQTFAQVSFEKRTIDSNFQAFFITACDLDRDGDQDVLSGRTELAWWRNDGAGHFSKRQIDSGLTRLFSIFPVDLDKDGDIDLLTCDIEEETIRWYKNNGGNFQKIHIIDNVFRAESVAAADFDKDGDIDIVVVTLETKMVSWWENNGNMNFNNRHDLATDFDRGHKVAVADINGDSYPDIVACAASSQGLCWWKNLGSGRFSKRTINSGGGLGMAIADINKDGTLDIIYCRHSAGEVILYLNNGNGSFSSKTLATQMNWPSWASVGDLNRDGRIDFVLVAAGRRDGLLGELLWFENRGNNNFTIHEVQNSTMNVPFMAEVADFDKDGNADIVSGYEWDRKLYWWKNLSASVRSITVLSPNGGEILSWGVDHTIEWESTGNIDNVKIEFSADEGINWSTVVNSTPNDGNYNWILPNISSDQCLIRISDTSDGDIRDTSDNSFSITRANFIVTGDVSYYSDGLPVKDVTLTANGGISLTETSDANGNYSFEVEGGNSFFVTPSKPATEDVGESTITTYDAALTARHSVGLDTLNVFQIVAADADEDGNISTFDAFLIHRCAVGLSNFTSSHVKEWRFLPESRSYQNLSSDQTNQNYMGIIIGNVHGGWTY